RSHRYICQSRDEIATKSTTFIRIPLQVGNFAGEFFVAHEYRELSLSYLYSFSLLEICVKHIPDMPPQLLAIEALETEEPYQ
ncbi:hypothetical protein Q6272_31735, partial [Klebsiella pneumoniae]